MYDSRDPGLENQPKPAFYAFRTLTRELTGHKFDAVLTQTNNAEAYSFSHPCQGTKIIAWNNQSTGTLPLVVNYVKSVVLVYRQNADGSENGRNKIIVDGDGNDLDGKVNGKISVALDKEPVIIQLKQ